MRGDALIAKVKVLPRVCGDAGMQREGNGRRRIILLFFFSFVLSLVAKITHILVVDARNN